jgi:hypothetical protein
MAKITMTAYYERRQSKASDLIAVFSGEQMYHCEVLLGNSLLFLSKDGSRNHRLAT